MRRKEVESTKSDTCISSLMKTVCMIIFDFFDILRYFSNCDVLRSLFSTKYFIIMTARDTFCVLSDALSLGFKINYHSK